MAERTDFGMRQPYSPRAQKERVYLNSNDLMDSRDYAEVTNSIYPSRKHFSSKEIDGSYKTDEFGNLSYRGTYSRMPRE
jgi:hypothetical protein